MTRASIYRAHLAATQRYDGSTIRMPDGMWRSQARIKDMKFSAMGETELEAATKCARMMRAYEKSLKEEF